MYRTAYYCLAIHLIGVNAFNGFDCIESEIIVSEEFCGYRNGSQSQLNMYGKSFNEEIFNSRNLTLAALANNGCPIEFDIVDFDNQFYVECETEINCPDEKEDVTIKPINYFLFDCENITLYDDNSTSNITGFITEEPVYTTDASTIEDDDKPFDDNSTSNVTGSITEEPVYTTDAASIDDNGKPFDDNSTSNVSGSVKEEPINTPIDTGKLAIVTGSVAAGLATIAGVAAAIYKLQTILQSGSYLLPNTPAPTGLSEMP